MNYFTQIQITVPIAVAMMSLFALLFTAVELAQGYALAPHPFLPFMILEPLW